MGGGFQPKGAADSRHFTGRQHQPKAQQRVVFQYQQTCCEDGGLQEGGQAQPDDLLAPLNKSIHVAAGNREHIQGTHSDLDEQDTAPLKIGEKAFNDGVSHHNDNENDHDGAGDAADPPEHARGRCRSDIHFLQGSDDISGENIKALSISNSHL